MNDTSVRVLISQFEAIRAVHYGAAVIDKSDVDRQIGHAWDRAVRMLRAAVGEAQPASNQFIDLHCRYCHVETNTTTMGLCDVCVGKVLRFVREDQAAQFRDVIAQWRMSALVAGQYSVECAITAAHEHHSAAAEAMTLARCADDLEARLAERPQPQEAQLHASAPKGYKCSDCTIDGEACPTCYAAWWKQRHPNHESLSIEPLGSPTP